MAESNPELQAKLAALDQELAEGDITQKGCVLLPLSFASDQRANGCPQV
jgi:hypothetical protein